MISIVYIGATWCSTCKVIKPETERLSILFGIPLTILDIDKDMDDAERDRITKVPTVRILENDIRVAEFNTAQVASLRMWLENHVKFVAMDADF